MSSMTQKKAWTIINDYYIYSFERFWEMHSSNLEYMHDGTEESKKTAIERFIMCVSGTFRDDAHPTRAVRTWLVTEAEELYELAYDANLTEEETEVFVDVLHELEVHIDVKTGSIVEVAGLPVKQ